MDKRAKEKLINRAKTDPYVSFLRADFTIIGEGHAEAHMPLHDKQRQHSDVAYGGVLVVLVDVVTGFTAYTVTPLGKDVLMTELKMSFLRVVWDNELIAKDAVVKARRSVYFCGCEIYCDDKLASKSSSVSYVVHPQV